MGNVHFKWDRLVVPGYPPCASEINPFERYELLNFNICPNVTLSNMYGPNHGFELTLPGIKTFYFCICCLFLYYFIVIAKNFSFKYNTYYCTRHNDWTTNKMDIGQPYSNVYCNIIEGRHV